MFSKFVSEKIDNTKEKIYECTDGDREFDVFIDLKKLKNSKIYLTCYDKNESDIDSTILQGIAYYNKLNIIGYESNPVRYYVEGKQEFGVTLMLEQSCNILATSIDETINKIINSMKYN